MSLLIGSEVTSYREKPFLTGVERVVLEAHRVLGVHLARKGASLVPVTTRTPVPRTSRPPSPDLLVDSLRVEDPVDLENVAALLILDPSSRIDFTRIAELRRRRHLPVISMIHDVMPLKRPDWFSAGAARNYRLVIQQLLHVSDRLFVPSHHVRDDVRALHWWNGAEIDVIPLGTWLAQQPPTTVTATPPHLVYVSTLAPRKGHRALLEAFDQLRAAGESAKLTIIGHVGWCVEELVQEITNHPEFGHDLRWIRDANDEEVRQTLRAATIAVIPSEDEGFGLFFEESLAAGLLVVASDIPVFRERSYRNVIFADTSPDGITQGIREAALRQPEALEPGEIRSMQDFGRDLSVVLDAVLE